MNGRRLGGLRTAIDAVDDGLLVLLAARRHLVLRVARLKRAGGFAPHDAQREAQVQARAQRLALHLGFPKTPRAGPWRWPSTMRAACRAWRLTWIKVARPAPTA